MTEQMQEAKATPAAQKAKAKSHPSNTIQTSSEIISVDEPENALPEVSLADLPQLLQTACAKAGWNSLMPVQSRALPYLLEGRDLMVQSRTGSGKTGTYLLPLMARLNPAMPAVQAPSMAESATASRWTRSVRGSALLWGRQAVYLTISCGARSTLIIFPL